MMLEYEIRAEVVNDVHNANKQRAVKVPEYRTRTGVAL